jgi:hypothetical protein
MKPKTKLENDFKNSLKLLEHYLKEYRNGFFEIYIPIAVELRKLLCDKNALLVRKYPGIKLHRIRLSYDFQTKRIATEGLILMTPGSLSFYKNGIPNLRLNMMNDEIKINISEWLDQPFMKADLSVRQIIKSIANKEAAHSDNSYNNELIYGKSIRYGEYDSIYCNLVALANYLNEELKEKVKFSS